MRNLWYSRLLEGLIFLVEILQRLNAPVEYLSGAFSCCGEKPIRRVFAPVKMKAGSQRLR